MTMRRHGAAGYAAGWLVAFATWSVATYQLSFLINRFGPSCRGGGPEHLPAMDLWMVPFAGFVGASVLVLLWWILAPPPGERGRRFVAAIALAGVSVPVGFVFAVFLTPICV
jgi:hypothetical protein